MISLIRYIALAIVSLLFSSCHLDINFGSGKKGNGHVVSESRNVHASFTEIKASEGIDVYITQDSSESITVEADENIIDLIGTKIKNGTLHIYAEENIGRTKAKKVHVSLPTIEKIVSTSGADVFSTERLNVDDLEVKSTSGADVKINVKATSVTCSTTSGADIRISGTAESLDASASSGSDIKAKNLEVEHCKARASSGADIVVYTTDRLIAHSSSGGGIHYYGNPESVSKNKSVSGGIHQK